MTYATDYTSVDEIYDANGDRLKGRREPRAYLLLDLAEAAERGKLVATVLRRASRAADLHLRRHGGRFTDGSIARLANIYYDPSYKEGA